jgi:hypothetical protein
MTMETFVRVYESRQRYCALGAVCPLAFHHCHQSRPQPRALESNAIPK